MACCNQLTGPLSSACNNSHAELHEPTKWPSTCFKHIFVGKTGNNTLCLWKLFVKKQVSVSKCRQQHNTHRITPVKETNLVEQVYCHTPYYDSCREPCMKTIKTTGFLISVHACYQRITGSFNASVGDPNQQC